MEVNNLKKNFTFPSSDGITNIHAVMWIPDIENHENRHKIRGIVQIVHGMVEYIERYDSFARYLNSYDYIVVGHDLLGHGQSVTSVENWGFIANQTGSNHPVDFLIHDINRLYLGIHKKYPGIPYFLLGHSMGSYLVRQYLAYEGSSFSGAILSGTGFESNSTTIPGMALIHAMAKINGWHYRSKVIRNMSYSNSYKTYDLTCNDKSNCWLTKDESIVSNYYKDPRDTYIFTLNGYDALLSSVCFTCQRQNISMIPKTLPILLASGDQDPVGRFGDGVREVYELYAQNGIYDLKLKLFSGDRHEILNETDRDDVYAYIVNWLIKRS